jgi:alkanesulfonate monooxygenase SsuD/methylene tetrahydromethanopterin reductase-like flavin-dependent oxidoreductase (luciferase family)
VLCAGRDDAEVARRASVIGREVEELRSNSPLVGTPAEIVDKLGSWADLGVQRAYAQLLDMSDLAHLELFADEVVPQLR